MMRGRHVAGVLGVIAALTGCGPRPEIRVVQATYGANCGVPAGNVTLAVSRACDGTSDCPYKVDVSILGDPKFGCAKGFQAVWRCPGEEAVRRVELDGEAGFGVIAHLTCDAPAHAPPR